MLTTKLAGIDEYPMAFRTTEDASGKEIVSCGSSVASPYFSSRMLVQAGLASCLAGTVYRAIKDAGIGIADVHVSVDLQVDESGMARSSIYAKVELVGVEQGREDDAKRVKNDALGRCFIGNLLSKGIDIVHTDDIAISDVPASERCCGL